MGRSAPLLTIVEEQLTPVCESPLKKKSGQSQALKYLPMGISRTQARQKPRL